MPADFYELLDVSEDASSGDIKAAYRQKAREYHPDVNDDDRASAQFKTVRTAYEVLSDAEEREAYDRMGHATYVRKRLDGLPTAGMSRPSANSRWSTGKASASSTSTTGSSGGARRSKSTAGSGRSAGRSGRSAGQSSGSAGSTGATRQSTASAGQSSRSARAGTGARSGHTAGRSSTSGRTSGRGRDGTAGQRRTATRNGRAQQTSSEASRRSGQSPLWGPLGAGWVAVIVAGVAYTAGLGWYLIGRAESLASFLEALTTAPTAALLTPHGLTDPLSYAVGALAAPSPALLFPVGAALLLVVFGVVVYRFGQGPTWLYVVAAAGPAAGFSLRQAVVAPPAVGDLLLFVVLPLVATVVFAVDLGRYLLASR